MYEAHFGLAELPFPTGQDPRYYVETTPHRAAVLALLAGLERGDEYLLVTGPFGVGKTTIARRLMAQVDRTRHRVVELASLRIEGDELLDRIAESLDAQALDGEAGPHALVRLLEGLAASGHAALVVIDEAQRLDVDGFDRLRRLTALRVAGRGVLQLCLVARAAPPAIDALRRAGRPLNVGVAVDVGPLDAAGTRDYVLARLNRVGWMGRPSFDDGAFAEIHARCGGIAGRVNRLCGYLLLQLYLLQRDAVDSGAVRAVDDLLQSELGGGPSALELPPVVAPTPETQSPLPPPQRQEPPEWHPPGGALATLPSFRAPRPGRSRRRWIQGAAAAAVLLAGGIAWVAMGHHAMSRVEEAQLASAWASMASAPTAQPHEATPTATEPPPRVALTAPVAASLPTSSPTPTALVSTPAQTIAQSPPGAGSTQIPVASAAPQATAITPSAGTARATPAVAAFVPRRLRDGPTGGLRGSPLTRAQDARPVASMAANARAAACSLESEALGLCAPVRDAAREPAADLTPRAASASSPRAARPACEPTRAALGLCAEH